MPKKIWIKIATKGDNKKGRGCERSQRFTQRTDGKRCEYKLAGFELGAMPTTPSGVSGDDHFYPGHLSHAGLPSRDKAAITELLSQ